jgi:OOP family OmpA-OmpF porin
MADDVAVSPEPAPAEDSGRRTNGSGAEFAALRQLLLGPEQSRLEELATELKERQLTAAEIAEQLPEAIVLRAKRDRQLGLALAPTIDTALHESIRRDPDDVAAAIFPVLGPAIRKAIAETMSALVRSINKAMDHAFTPRGIRWRLESWRTGVPYAQVVIKHALVYRVEQAYLVHAETGLLLAHATEPGLKVPDADLISGMLTVIQDFVRDAFRPGEGAMLRTFSVGDHTVQVEAGPLAVLALVIRGEAPETVLWKQQHAIETIHQQFATALNDFAGDTRPFHSAGPLLDDCLETVVDTGPEKHSRFSWMRWAIPLGAAIAALAITTGRSRARFDRALSVLRQEPGLVVMDANRGWGQWEISGMRDPDARTPRAVLAGAGLVPRSLLGDWKPFISLDSAVVVARGRQALGLLESTQLSLREGTLTVMGDIPLRALPVLQAGRVAPGIARIELGEVNLVLPTHLQALRDSLVAARVLFATDESRIDRARPAILRTAAQFIVLHDSVLANSGDLTLTLIGRTDPTGLRERNRTLAQQRVDRVRAILARAGVQPEHLREEALAADRPLDAPDTTERARINRSVSYEITIRRARLDNRQR